MLGRGDHLSLPFIGPANRELESEHVKLARQANGSYVVEDNHSKLGTRLNNQPLLHPAVLKDGDVIKFGGNFVRFNQRQHQGEAAPPAPAPTFQVRSAPPPPPIKHAPASADGAARPGPATKPPASPGPRPAPPAAPRSGGIPPPPPPRKPKS
jgi:hypothetical protein